MLAIVVTTFLLSFKLSESKLFEFNYPERDNTTIVFKANNFDQFKKEWRGEDYYYFGVSQDSIICSILYFKLNKDEQKLLVEPFGGITSAAMPFVYFSDYSKLKKYEKNNEKWGEMTDDFMFRQNDIEDFNGIKMKQKHMYAYGMFYKDIFINMHLSKTNYTASDSIAMREILSSLVKKK
jgi:hypothetical protein